jgi:hypothetical protein
LALDYQKQNYAGVPPTNYQSGDLDWISWVLRPIHRRNCSLTDA